MELSAEYLREKLQRDLEAEHVEVEDTTPNRCASSFRVLVVSAKFEGKPLLQRHRFPGPGELPLSTPCQYRSLLQRPGPGRSHRQGSSGSRTVQERL
ncbi:bolA-like protein 2 isoform X7 [Bos mutus]|uniref:bolA-like protein 2 isoform X7 n=1 Tax=Bos mutus TaxID=72004 RepID=UPI0038B5A246